MYQTYINMMNEHIRQQMDVANPFKFQHITNLKSIDQFDDSGPSVSKKRTDSKQKRANQDRLENVPFTCSLPPPPLSFRAALCVFRW